MTLQNLARTLLAVTLLTAIACEKQDGDLSERSEASTHNTPEEGSAVAEKAEESEKAQDAEGAVPPSSSASQSSSQQPTSAFKVIEWTDLMPQEDIDALLNPPEYISEIEDGSFEDQISGQLQNAISAASDDRYQQALASTQIIEEMDGQAIRLPGFIVPLEFDDEQTITQFFLVPFFGACIHVPPPPPNQIIFVNYPEGLQLDALYDPFWISGTLKTAIIENDIAKSAYSMEMQQFEPYTE